MNTIGNYLYREFYITLKFNPDNLKFSVPNPYDDLKEFNTPQEALTYCKKVIDLYEHNYEVYQFFSKFKVNNCTAFDILHKEMWSLDGTFASYMFPRVLFFKIHYLNRIPSDFMDFDYKGNITCEYIDEWEEVLNSIILALQLMHEDCATAGPAVKRKINYGLKLFIKYIDTLWV